MEKELKDYLHLYLGCEMMIVKENKKVSFDTIKRTEKFKVWTTDEKYCKPLRLCGHGFSYKEVKPILRPLSDMTAIELHECQRFSNNVQYDIFNSGAERTLYLIKQGFDLFNLIPEGLAIDKTTL